MPNKLLKKASEKKINEFFKSIKSKKPKEIKKIKKLAMRHNLKFGEKRKLFCKNCYSVFSSKNSEVRIKKRNKIVKCKECGNVMRWKMKGEII